MAGIVRIVKPKWHILGPVLGGLGAATVVVVVLMFEYYEPLWKATTGEPYTHIMRRNPWVLPTLAFPLMGLAVWKVPFHWWGRVLLVWVVGGLWFLAGHVFW